MTRIATPAITKTKSKQHDPDAQSPVPQEGCSPEDVCALVENKLSLAKISRVEGHLTRCAWCRQLKAELETIDPAKEFEERFIPKYILHLWLKYAAEEREKSRKKTKSQREAICR